MSRFDNEPFTLSRDVDAVIVPAGINVKLRTGQSGFITQALGGSFTVYVEGNLFRVAGKDADALGKELAAVPELPPDASDADVRELAWQQMKTCYDPEIPINIVELGLVYECKVERAANGEREVKIKMTLTAPGCGMGEILAADVREKVGLIPTVARADYVFACMQVNGQTRDALERCSCSIDAIAALLPYEKYEEAETIMRVRQRGGQNASMFSSTPQLRAKVDDLKRAQVEAELRCF